MFIGEANFKGNLIMVSRNLRINSDKFLKQGKRINAIKYVRENRDWGLKEAHEYIKLSSFY